MKRNLWKGIAFVLFFSYLFILFGQAIAAESSQKTDKKGEVMKVAFVYHGTVGDYGWFFSHDKARKITDEKLEFVKTTKVENVTPGSNAERVLKELCKDDFQVIVSASQDYEADVKKVAKDFPNVKFLICAGSISIEPNIESFYPKTTQPTYMLGQLAGMLTKTNVIGIVGSVVSPLDLQIHNSWVLGAKSVNHEVKARIIFLNTYFDPAAERTAALSLIDAGADVLIQSTNTSAHVIAAEEAGIFAMSHYEDMGQFGENAYVTGEIFFWEKYYIETFKSIKEGTWKPRMYYPDLTTGVSDLAPIRSMVNDEMKKVLKKTRKRMLSGEPEFFWNGPIKDNKGKVRVKEGERLTVEQATSMDWFVDGVVTAEK